MVWGIMSLQSAVVTTPVYSTAVYVCVGGWVLVIDNGYWYKYGCIAAEHLP